MYSGGSTEFNNLIESPGGNALVARLTFDDFAIDRFTKLEYHGGSNNSDDIAIGTTNMAYLEVGVITDKYITNHEFLLEVGMELSDGTIEYAPMGYFTVQKPSGDEDTTDFMAYDRMQKFEKSYFSALTYPTDSAKALNELCTMCGVELATPITNPITIEDNLQGYTCREVLGYIAGIHGKFACIDRYGKLNLRWYSETLIEKQIGLIWSLAKSQGDYAVEKIALAKDSETTYTSGDGISGINHSNPYATQTIADSIYTSLGGFTYRVCEISTLDDIRLDPWDMVQVTYFDGSVLAIPAMSLEHSFTNGETRIKSFGKTDTENEYNYSGPITQAMNRMSTELLVANRIIATKVDAEWVNAHTVMVAELEATNARVGALEVNALTADSAVIKSLQTDKLNTSDLNAETAKLGYLTAKSVVITDLDASIADINTLIFGSATGTVIQTEFANSVIAQLGEAQIKSAMIESVSAEKLTTGTIYTDDVTIRSKSGNMILSDNTIQISDGTNVRVQIGKDASNDYSINIWDSAGNLMFSQGGITDSAIKSAIIRNDMVSEKANISASKLDIDSLFTVINEDNSHTLKSTRIYFDDERQTLDVVFKELSTSVTEQGETISSQGTSIETIQGQITSKIWQQDITTATTPLENSITTLNTQYSSLSQDLNGFKTEVSQTYATTSSVNEVANDLTANYSTTTQMNSIVNQSASNVLVKVSGLYATKDSVNNIQVDNRNLVARKNSVIGWIDSSGNYHSISDWDKTFRTADYISVKPGEEYTLQYWWPSGASEAWFLYAFYDSDKNFITVNPNEVHTENGYYTITITIPDGASYIVITWNDLDGYKIKLEKGNKKTDWSPAYEDITNSLEVGGRNLQLGSQYWDDTAWFDKDLISISGEVATLYGNYVPKCSLIPVDINSTYTVSFEVRTDESVPVTSSYGLYLLAYYDDSNNRVAYVRMPGIATNDWRRIINTVTVPNNTSIKYLSFGPRNNGSWSAIHYRHLKIEKGDKATDWTPAPEDIDHRMDSIDAKLELKIDKDDNDQVVSMINASADEINLKANRFSLESTYASITKTGVVNFKSGNIGGFTLSDGVLSSVAQDYLLPDGYVMETVHNAILDGVSLSTIYDFNADGKTDLFDLVTVKNYINGIETKDDFKNWQYAESSEVNFAINPNDSSKAISITATDMWGRSRSTYLGINGLETDKVTTTDLIARKSFAIKDDSQTVFAIYPDEDVAILKKGLSIGGDLIVNGIVDFKSDFIGFSGETNFVTFNVSSWDDGVYILYNQYGTGMNVEFLIKNGGLISMSSISSEHAISNYNITINSNEWYTNIYKIKIT